MEFDDVLKTRRSMRKYKNQKLTNEQIHQLIEGAILAPSWKNSQVTRYYVAQSEEALLKVKDALPEFNQNNVIDAPALIVTTIVKNRSGFERDGTPTNELGNGWGYYDCGMHNMCLLLQATQMGLATLVMGIRDEVKLKDIFSIPDNEAVVSVIAVGYGDIEPPMPKRKTVEEITHIL